MSLSKRRILAVLLMIAIIAISLLIRNGISLPQSGGSVTPEPLSAKPEPNRSLFIAVSKLNKVNQPFPSSITINNRKVPVQRKGRYGLICFEGSCALLKRGQKKFVMAVGDGAEEGLRKRIK